ncbi:hypothetical protein SAMN05444172_4747 [Burkholderia sp. GAS332]|nr:hypothetical protein SAMN05444172_4747 [Burkholderia sp. GAS332]
MSVIAETKALRRQLRTLAATPEWDLLARYDLLGKKPPSTFKARVWRRIRRLMSVAGLISPHVSPYPWMSTLKHRAVTANAKTWLIWAIGADRDELRAACEGFSTRLQSEEGIAAVLVTDVADFAYFSRLGWLVEYLPNLSGEGQSYKQRKQTYLAWRYRNACIVPLSAGHASESEWNAVLKVS